MEANGKAWPTIEELKAVPSDHPLSCLVTLATYKIGMADAKWSQPLLTLENLSSDHPLSMLSRNIAYKSKLGKL
eukprot:scaffold7921_cov68-Cyclotella_meneghiniana.AAC.6